jgi:phosphoenolpyruvate carboxykinase (ATP)
MLSKNSSVIRRYFGSASKECLQSLKKLGFRESLEVVHNPTVGELYEYALRPEHQDSCDPSVHDSTITETGALSCSSGERTGRSPKDKRIVLDETTKEIVNWGKVNIPLEPHSFLVNKSRAVDFLNTRKRIFVVDSFAGWDEAYRMNIRIISSRPYHALFMKQMLIRAPTAHIQN